MEDNEKAYLRKEVCYFTKHKKSIKENRHFD